jgi:hypothetical protein
MSPAPPLECTWPTSGPSGSLSPFFGWRTLYTTYAMISARISASRIVPITMPAISPPSSVSGCSMIE